MEACGHTEVCPYDIDLITLWAFTDIHNKKERQPSVM